MVSLPNYAELPRSDRCDPGITGPKYLPLRRTLAAVVTRLASTKRLRAHALVTEHSAIIGISRRPCYTRHILGKCSRCNCRKTAHTISRRQSIFERRFAMRSLRTFLLSWCVWIALFPAPARSAGVISDIFDYQLVGALFSRQFLYDDTLPVPEFQQGPVPILTLANPGIAASREVWFLEPGDFDANDPSLISDIVAVRPVAGNQLELHFWSDDPTVTAAQFRAGLGLTGPPVATIVEDGLAHDVNGALFGIVPASPFLHII